jgi:hypothetical protein
MNEYQFGIVHNIYVVGRHTANHVIEDISYRNDRTVSEYGLKV